MLLIRWHIKLGDFDFDNTLIDKKLHEDVFIFEISYKNLISAKPLHNRFYQVDGFIKVYNGSRFLVLFRIKKYDAIYNRIWYLIGVKGSITYVFFSLLCKS